MQTTRLIQYWDRIRPKLETRWPEVPETKWQVMPQTYDEMIEIVRNAVYPGRSEITVEAEVRDLINQLADSIEYSDQRAL